MKRSKFSGSHIIDAVNVLSLVSVFQIFAVN